MKLGFIGADDGAIVGLDEAGHKLLNLALNGLQFARGVRSAFFGIRLALLPKHFEHGMGGEQQLLRGPNGVDQAVEVAFQRCLADILASHRAALGEAPIVRVARALAAPCPSGGHGPVAAGAVDEAPQREIIAQIGTLRRYSLTAMQPLINLEECFVGDERLMLGGNAVHPPFRHAHVPGIEHLRENLVHLLRMNGAQAILREDGIVLQEALHLGLRFKAA